MLNHRVSPEPNVAIMFTSNVRVWSNLIVPWTTDMTEVVREWILPRCLYQNDIACLSTIECWITEPILKPMLPQCLIPVVRIWSNTIDWWVTEPVRYPMLSRCLHQLIRVWSSPIVCWNTEPILEPTLLQCLYQMIKHDQIQSYVESQSLSETQCCRDVYTKCHQFQMWIDKLVGRKLSWYKYCIKFH